MASSFTNLNYHIVFSTRYRRQRIVGEFQQELYHYIGGIIQAHDGVLLEIGGIGDHVHVLTGFSPTVAVSDLIRLVKANSSKWANERGDTIDRFEWQTGYGAFTVSRSNVESVRRYIRDQEDHHRTVTFQEEFITLLKRHEIEFDTRHVFEQDHTG